MDDNINIGTTEIIAEFANFEPVWQRVTGSDLNMEDGKAAAASAEFAGAHIRIEEKYELDGGTKNARPPVQIPQISGDALALRAFLDDEAHDAAFYRTLSESAGRYKPDFRKISADENEHAKKLQIEYFLLMGESYIPPAPVIVLDGVLNSMRQAYLSERAGSDAYIAAAEKTANSTLKSLYLELARCEMEHAGELRQMISKTLPDRP